MKFFFRKFGLSFTLALAMMAGAPAAQAGFIGNNVSFELHHPGVNGNLLGSQTGMIANGTTFGPIYSNQFSATFTDNTIMFGNEDCCQFAPDVYYVIKGTDLGITGASINAAASNQPGLSPSAISFDANNIYINVGEMFLSPQNHFLVDVTFERGTVPEPGTAALFGLALAGLAVARRRKA